MSPLSLLLPKPRTRQGEPAEQKAARKPEGSLIQGRGSLRQRQTQGWGLHNPGHRGKGVAEGPQKSKPWEGAGGGREEAAVSPARGQPLVFQGKRTQGSQARKCPLWQWSCSAKKLEAWGGHPMTERPRIWAYPPLQPHSPRQNPRKGIGSTPGLQRALRGVSATWRAQGLARWARTKASRPTWEGGVRNSERGVQEREMHKAEAPQRGREGNAPLEGLWETRYPVRPSSPLTVPPAASAPRSSPESCRTLSTTKSFFLHIRLSLCPSPGSRLLGSPH